MSTQACLIKGFGYKFKYDDKLFPHLVDENKEYDFICLIGLDVGYYQLRDTDSNKHGLLAIVTDGMCGEYKYVIYVTEATYILNTHGDDFWHHTYRNDEYIKKYTKENIELLLGRKLEEPQEFTFEHYQ